MPSAMGTGSKIQVNPLAAEVRAMLELSEEASEQLIVVIRQPALWHEVSAAIDPDAGRKHMVIMKPSEYRALGGLAAAGLQGPMDASLRHGQRGVAAPQDQSRRV
jgi:hypothetical protein